jgi:predicted SAM-dependent methyltransferase
MPIRALKSLVLSGVRRAGYELVKVRSLTPSAAPATDATATVANTVAVAAAQPVDAAAAPAASPSSDASAEESIVDKELYLSLYGTDVFQRRPFLNVGAGNFRHPAWRNLDFYTEGYASDVSGNIDIEMDLSRKLPWPIESDSIEAVFTSHTIEHLQNHHDRHIFSEVFRVLKPGGFFRITCPDIELYYRAYMRGDRHFFPSYGTWYLDESDEQLFLREFATQISTASNDGIPVPKCTTEEIRQKFHTMKMDEALDSFTNRVDYNSWYKVAPGNHVNWWSYDKVFAFLREAGFREVYRSGFGQSSCPPMRTIPLFDWTAQKISLYAEAVKLPSGV